MKIGVEEEKRSLMRRVFGDTRTNFIRVKSSMMKVWQHRGPSKMVSLNQNTFRFIFARGSNHEGILQG